ncbi:hypothetical protein ACGFIW_01880 [Micromonospora sp. NPDC048935]|uniref:hypothetical protein n=1 Tax=Micromonospora sp. NPDC048935 TaxID=3364262 RepID=UPI0037178BEA
MTTRWEVEKAVKASSIDITGKCILMMLLSETNASTAEIAPKHAPTYTELEATTSASRSTLVEWMRALTAGGWVRKLSFEGESRTGYALSVGDPNTAREPRARASKATPKTAADAHQAEADDDGACRLAAQSGGGSMPPGDTEHAARRYADVPPGDTSTEGVLIRNSPTESSTTNPTLTPPLFGEGATTGKARRASKPKKAEPYREDVERVCTYLVEWIVKNGSKRPTISNDWRAEARRMIDLDKRSLDDIHRVTRWSQKHHFWKGNIMSIPKLREKFDQLRLRMEAEEAIEAERNQQSGRMDGGMKPANPRILRNSHENQDRYDVKL